MLEFSGLFIRYQSSSSLCDRSNIRHRPFIKKFDLPLPPASMSKLMTLYMTFEFIKAGRLGLDEKLPVSINAAKYTGSTMFLDPTDRVAV